MDALQRFGDWATPLRFQYFNAQLDVLSVQVGFPTDQLRLVFCLFAAYPLAIVLENLRDVQLKHWFNIAVGVSMAQFVYTAGWLHSFLSALATYVLMMYVPIQYAPYVVFVFNMAYVAVLHIHRMTVDYMGWNIDATATQMLLLIKLTSFAYNYYDGVVASATAVHPHDSQALVRMKQIRQRLAIREIPSLLEYFGYVFYFTTFLAGPSFEYREYIESMEGTRFVHNNQRKEPSSTWPAMKKCIIGLSFMALLARFGSFTNLPVILRMDEPVLIKWGRILVALFLIRGKYYTAWKLSEGATILSGAGFEGFDAQGNPKGWNGVSNVDILGFEFGESVRDLSRAWNKGTQLWLERYVYSRTKGSLWATYLCSAIWHGFYPGYYLFFLTIPLATAVSRLSRHHLRPLFLHTNGQPRSVKVFYDMIGMLCTALIVNYLAVSFVVLSWEESLRGFKSMHFAGHIGLVSAYLLLLAFPAKKAPKQV